MVLVFVVALSANVRAHPMPNTTVNLSVLDRSITGIARLPLLELQTAMGGQSIRNINSAFVKSYFSKHIVATSGTSSWLTSIISLDIISDHDEFIGDFQEVVVHFELTPEDVGHLRSFVFNYDAIIHEVVTHQILIFVKQDWKNGVHENSGSSPIGVIRMDVQSGKIIPLTVSLEPGNFWKGFFAMVHLGIKHICEGLDHILFLLTLLLVAPLTVQNGAWSAYQGIGYTVTRFLKISIAFTIGHSLTLLAGSFNLVDFRIQYVEVTVALSILISAVNCIKPIFFTREISLAAMFGLIHGLAFSITLSHLELSPGNRFLAVVGFNLGIEIMQVIIMLFFLPILLLSQFRFYPILRTTLAVCAITVSAAWVVERISAHQNLITVIAGGKVQVAGTR
jgi:hypothetical protein